MMDRKLFSANRNISWLCIPSVNSVEQCRSWTDLFFAFPVKFVIAMFLHFSTQGATFTDGAVFRQPYI